MAELYEYLTPDTLGDFSGSGTQSLLQVLLTPDISRHEADDIASLIFTEILILIEAKTLDVDAVTAFLKVAITDDAKASVFCQVFDVFPLSPALELLLIHLHKEQHVINASSMAQYIDSDTLIKISLVPGDSLNRQLNTRKRDEFFTQRKFNLFHEEFEGYTKLINETLAILQSRENEFQVGYMVQLIELIMGHYLLDPNRTLDVLLDVFANFLIGNHRFIIDFLKISLWWPSIPADNSGLESFNVGGCDAAAKLIALRFSRISADRAPSQNFKILVGILIKEGFVSLGSIFPYFRAEDEDMQLLEQQYKTELDEKVFRASASALALAAPIADDEEEGAASDATKPTVAKAEAKATVESLLKKNVMVQMLKIFLANGMYWPSLFIISQHPFLVHCDPEVSELMHRLLAVIIEPLHSAIAPFTKAELSLFQKRSQRTIPRKSISTDTSTSEKRYSVKPSRSLQSDENVYVYTEWDQSLPLIHSTDDLINVSKQFIKFFGVQLANDTANFIKICEIIAADLKDESTNDKKEEWFSYFRNYILPVIGNIEDNAIPVDKAYAILKFFSAEDRFNLYGELHQVLAKNNVHVRLFYGRAEKATKNVLKRLSKENVKPMMRRLAKISTSNPLPCFLTILQQIESYDNLNALVVETAAFFNEYGWDNLILAILMRLTTAGRSNLQANGINERQWIQSLASFVGKICQKYPANMDLSTLLDFLLKSFHSNDHSVLIVLKEILVSMGGIQAITNLTQLQINMINCGSSMEKIVYTTIGDLRYDRFNSGSILCRKLFENDRMNEFFVLLCKLGSDILSGEQHTHLKALANKKDEVDAVLHLFCTLIGFFASHEMANGLIPLDELSIDFNIPLPWAAEFWRKFIIREDLGKHDFALEKDSLSSKIASSSSLYTAFWSLDLYDINYSPALYDSELEKMQASVTRLKEELAFARRDRDTSEDKLLQIRGELERSQAFVSAIPEQKVLHEKHFTDISRSLTDKSPQWFAPDDLKPFKVQAEAFLQECILPRAVHSSFDALFCAGFLFKIHGYGTARYVLTTVLDVLFKSKLLFGSLFTCTPTEAENLGLFVSAVLKDLFRLSDKETFEKEFAGSSISFSDFRALVYEYHSVILSDIGGALTVKDYMSRMNAITFLKNLLGIYPLVEDHCEEIIKLIEHIALHEERDDLKLSSSALIGHVKSRMNSWVHLWDFIDMDEKSKSAHMEKRRVLKEQKVKAALKEKQDKLRQAQEEEERRRLALKEKMDKEKSEQQLQAAAKAISYDDASLGKARTTARVDESSKGRYDYYSKFGASKESTTGSIEKTNASPAPSDESSKVAKVDNSAPQSKGTERTSTPDDIPKPLDSSKESPSVQASEKATPKALASETKAPPKTKASETKATPKPQASDKTPPKSQASDSKAQASESKVHASETSTQPSTSKHRANTVDSRPRPGAVASDAMRKNQPKPTYRESQRQFGKEVPRTTRDGSAPKSTGFGSSNFEQKRPSYNEPSNRANARPSAVDQSSDLFELKISSREPTKAKPGLQARLLEVKQEYKAKNERSGQGKQTPVSPAASRSLTPTAPHPPSSAPPNARARAPLPPQQAPRDSRGYTRYDRSVPANKPASREGRPQAPLPPPKLPPPSVPPPKRENGRDDSNGYAPKDNKRRYDGAGREFEKKRRY